jgi:protein-L-isoaspartate O-methyltransferase
MVAVHKIQAQLMSQLAANGGLACPHGANEKNIAPSHSG